MGNAYKGKSALRITFDGSGNIDFKNVSQTLVVKPGRYRFSAAIRSENITTDQGVLFRIFDTQAENRLSVETEATRGTTAWHEIALTLVVPPATRSLQVQVVRRPSLRFDNKISGSVWIDQVSLTPVN